MEQNTPRYTMADDIRDRVAADFLALFPLLHKQMFRFSQGISGLKGAQYRVLGILMKAGALPMSELGRRLYISKPYMTALADSLIENGLVERQQDPEDRRVIRIAITPSGKKYLRESLEGYKKDLKILFGDLDESDLVQLEESLSHLRTILAKVG